MSTDVRGLMVLLNVSEKAFMQMVIDAARLLGWRVYHTFDSRRSPEGFPDLVLVRDGRLVFAELKTERGKLSPSQQAWLAELEEVRYQRGIEVYTWRPRDWEQIERVLRGGS